MGRYALMAFAAVPIPSFLQVQPCEAQTTQALIARLVEETPLKQPRQGSRLQYYIRHSSHGSAAAHAPGRTLFTIPRNLLISGIERFYRNCPVRLYPLFFTPRRLCFGAALDLGLGGAGSAGGGGGGGGIAP